MIKTKKETKSVNININVFGKLQIFAFSLYQLVYALYMGGYLPQIVNYACIAIFFIISVICYLINNHNTLYLSNKNDLYRFLWFVLFVLFSSIIVQISNNEFGSYLFTSIMYLILPFAIVFFWNGAIKNTEEQTIYFYIYFIRLIIQFFLTNNALSWEFIKNITIFDSRSSIYESSLAHDFFFFVVIMLFMNKRILAIISAFFCFLSLKRLSLVFSIAALLLFSFIPKKKCKKWIIWVCIIITVLLPVIYGWLISPTGQSMFFDAFGIELDYLFTGRIYSINNWLKNIEHINGFGSISYFINVNNYTNGVYSMHCDLYQLCLECSIIGVILFAVFIFKLGSKNYYSILLTIYLVLCLFFSHMFDVLSIWILFYMFVFFSDRCQKNSLHAFSVKKLKKRRILYG